MSKSVPGWGDVYWINPNPTSSREIKNQHGIVTTVPVTGGGNFARSAGFAVPITGYDTVGVALCNQVRSFDIEVRIKAGTARYVETVDAAFSCEILDRVVSILDPEELRS